MTDLTECARLHQAAFPNRRAWSVGEFADFQNDPLVDFVYTDHGFAIVRTLIDEMEVVTIAVDPAHHRTGQGRQLIHHVVHQAKATSCQAIFLEVKADNVAATALYTAFGFARVGLRRAYYADLSGKKHDAMVMRLDLSTDSVRQT